MMAQIEEAQAQLTIKLSRGTSVQSSTETPTLQAGKTVTPTVG
jgi:hypothetical protein